MNKIILIILLLMANNAWSQENNESVNQSNTTNSVQEYKPVKVNQDYYIYSNPPFVAGTLNTSQIKIFYFFNYTSQSGYEMFKFLRDYQSSTSPINIIFTPIYFKQYQFSSAKIALVLNALNLQSIHAVVYGAIINKTLNPDSLEDVANFVASHQNLVSKEVFTKTYNSDAIKDQINLMPMIVQSFGVRTIPSVSVNGVFYSDYSLANSSPQRFKEIFLAMLQDYYNITKNQRKQ